MACLNLLGKARPLEEYTALTDLMPEWERNNRRDWTDAITQGPKEFRTWVKLQNLTPYFVSAPDSALITTILSKAVRIEHASGQIRTATFLQFESQMTTQNARITAMHQYNPIYRFMCDKSGVMVHANKMAWEAYSSGGDMEREEAYQEAVKAVFEKRVSCHRHLRCYTSRKTGKRKWTVLEMWPIADPLDDKLAVMVSEYNMTQQKELELQLSAQHLSLQRQNAELETLNANIQTEKEHLREQNTHLTERLEAVAQTPPSQGINADTPLDLMLSVLQKLILGESVPLPQIMDLRKILTESTTDLRQPIGLERQLLESCHATDGEVGLSMLQLLKGKSVKQRPSSEAPNALAGKSQHSPARRPTPSFADQAQAERRSISAAITPAIERMLQDASTQWQFDILGFAEATPGYTLSLLGFHMLKSQGFISEFNVDEAKLCMYLRRIEAGYDNSIPYHNSTHVASVLQMTHMLMVHGGVVKSQGADRLTLLASYIAALVHDYEHSGFNNDFLIKTSHDLAVTYNLQSPLENHHLAASTRVFLQQRYNFLEDAWQLDGALELQACGMAEPQCCLQDMPQEDKMALRMTAIDQVLGTDMKKHFSILSRFQGLFKRTNSTGGSSAPMPTFGEGRGRDLADLKAEDRSTLHQMVLKCADIGHLAADPATHKCWSLKLEEEFFRQGDKEKELGLSVSPLMDRSHKGGITRSQIGFFSIVGIPMYRAMVAAFEDARPLLDGVMGNYKCWEAAAASGKDPRV
ncbi:putative 3',5'-cyclic phosphodiesterase pde-3 [Trebouxia sp. C0009 RCD-2024]